MPLSSETIHKPLSDFFLSKFSTPAGSPVFFRFDKFGSVVSDDDFVNPEHPEWGYVPAIAAEKFSDLVNRVPVDMRDGINILLSGVQSIDNTYYYHTLNPSVPYVPPGSSEAVTQSIVAAFGRIKNDAMKRWDQMQMESTKLMLKYTPAVPTPVNWYDRTKNDVWTHYSLTVTESATPPKPGPAPPIFRLKMSDASVKTLLQVPPTAATPVNMSTKVLSLATAGKPNLVMAAAPVAFKATAAAPPAMIGARAMAMAPMMAAQPAVGAKVSSAVLHDQLITQVRALPLKDRVMVAQYMGNVAPTQPATTKSVVISFEYCKTDIGRPWYFDPFLRDQTWFVPGVAKGQLTVGSEGMSMLPIGFVAIRNLSISAAWTSEDVQHAHVSEGFGPFQVSFDSAHQTLVHPGVQIFGWVLEKLPQLPPNDPQK